jgi:hypothetical protein
MIILAALCPTGETRLADITALSEAQDYRALLPSALAEPLLLSLARDMRLIERMMSGDSDVDPQMDAPLQMVYELLMRPKNDVSVSVDELRLSESAMADAFTLFQCALEREIVARAVGVRADKQDECLLLGLDAVCVPIKSAPPMH